MRTEAVRFWAAASIAACSIFWSDLARAQIADEIKVCHGEYEQICRSYPVDVWERCARGIAGGADPRVTCRKLCGTLPGPNSCSISPIPGYPPSRSGNFCGYSWFAVRCVAPTTSSRQMTTTS
jgi:hypothetical protein